MIHSLVAIFENNILLALIVLLVIIPVYHKLGLLYWLTGKNGEKSNKELSSQMTELREHYNHDTSRMLDDLIVGQKEIQGSLSRIENTLNNVDRFGVRIRNGKNNENN